jgi:hypothetical protein
MFSTRSPEEKQAIMDTLVEEYYLPNAQKFWAKLGLDVKQYEAFVRQLFSLDTKELTIPWPEGNQITLKFLKKDINATVPVESMLQSRMDDILPLDFVLDGSDEQEMQKLAATMPGKNWHTINGSKYDPQQTLSLDIGGKNVTGYGYKIMHGGEERYVITEKYVPQWPTPDKNMKVLTKDGSYKRLSETKEEDVVMPHMNKNTTDDAYKVWAKEPLVYSMQPQDIQWLLTAYCLNNSTNLSDEDKAKLFAPVPKPQALSQLFTDEILGNDDKTKKTIEDQEQYAWETAEWYEQRMKQNAEVAMKAWDDILGVKSAKFEKGTQLAIQNVDSIFTQIPGNGGYMMLEITDADNRDHPTKFKYKIVWWVEADITAWWGSLAGKESNWLPFTDDFFGKLKDYGNGTIYKFPPQHKQDNIVEYAKSMGFGNAGMDLLKGRMEMLSWNDGKLENNVKEEIKYFGTDMPTYNDKNPSEKSYIMFETKFSGNKVSIKDKNGSYKRDMTYTEFIIFMADKGLRPYSQKQYDEDIAPVEMNNAKSKAAIFVMSPMNIIDGVKKRWQGTMVEWVKRSNDRRVEKIEEMFYTGGMTSWLSNMPIYGEYFAQAQDEFNTKIADKHHKIIMEGDSTINQRWRKIVRGKETYIKNHNLKWQYRIKALAKIESLFLKVKNGWSLDDIERREAMAWLLYVLDKFGVNYPMILSKYAGQHLWPRLLLNDEKYRIYIKWFNEAKHKLEQGQARGEDVRELMDAVMHYDVAIMSELMKDEHHRYIYGFKTIPVLQEHGEKRKNDATRQDGKKAAGNHPAFERAYLEEVQGRMNKWEYGYVIGALVQLSQRKEIANPVNYRRWLGWVMQMLLSGGMRYAANRSDRKYLRDFLRKHGFPFSDYILDNAQWGKDLGSLLEIISRNAGCSETFLKGTWRSPALDSYEWWWKDEANKKFMKSFDKWFIQGGNAQKIVPFLENSNLHKKVNLITIQKDPSIDPKLTNDEKNLLGRFMDVALMANNTRDFDAYKSKEDFVQNIIQDRTIFNTSRWLVNQEYMNYNMKGTFWDNQEAVQYFWNSFRDVFKRTAASDEVPKESVALLIKKYYTMFQDSYGGKHEWFPLMLWCIKSTDSKSKKARYAEAWVSEYIAKNSSGPFPPMMKEAFGEFEKFLVKYGHLVDDDMIQDIFYDDGNLEAATQEREKAVKAFENIQNPSFHKKYWWQVEEYLNGLFSKHRTSNNFKWFTNKVNGVEQDSDDIYNNWRDAQDQETAQVETEQAIASQREEEEKSMADEKERQEAQEAERKQKQKEKEEAEAKKRQEEEEAKKNQQGGGEK